jgi:hypothetical protein
MVPLKINIKIYHQHYISLGVLNHIIHLINSPIFNQIND